MSDTVTRHGGATLMNQVPDDVRMDTAVLDELSAWWDGVELWIVQLWFPFQFVVVMVVVVPVCLGVAWVVDRSVDWVAARIRSGSAGRDADQRVGERTGE